MLALRSVAGTSPAVAQRFPSVLQIAGRSAQERRGGRPAAAPRLHRAACRSPGDDRGGLGNNPGLVVAPTLATGPAAAPPAPTAAAATGTGLSPAEIEAELAAVPEPQRKIAAMLPLSDLPPEWTVGKSGERHLEIVQRRQPLREDRRPRRELHPVRRQGDGLRLLPPDRRPVERASALHLRDGRSPQGAGQVRLGEARRVQDRRDRQRGLHHRRQHAVLLGAVLYPDRLDPGRPQVRRLRAGTGQARRRQPEAGRCRGPDRVEPGDRPVRL